MTTFVVDASVAIKWVLPEPGSDRAMALLRTGGMAAPELWWAECANILWKAHRRGELDSPALQTAGRFIATAGVEIVEMTPLFEPSIRLAVELDHPAYDAFYLVLAGSRGVPMITADRRLVSKLTALRRADLLDRVTLLADLVI